MKKSTLVVPMLIFGCLFFIIPASSQEDMQFVNVDAFGNSQRPPSVFEHDEHNELAQIESCNECHHLYDDNGNLLEDESSEDQSCSECHKLAASGKKLDLKKAFHMNCKGCHRQKKKGPVMCGQCHVRGLQAAEI